MGYCLYRPQPFEAGPGAESVRSVADSCWSRIKGRDKVELKLGCGNYDPQTPPSTLDSISLKDYPDRLLGLAATACVGVVCHALADPVPGLGIALPILVPILTTAVIALLLSYRQAAPLAYISGSLGVLIGADLLNLDKLQGLGAPIASIGGAGTFDGIFLVGILAVLIASISSRTGGDRSAFATRRP